MSAQDWRPSAEIDTLKARSRLLSALRAFFDAREYLEVETPILNTTGTVDPNVESIWVEGARRLLHTSPEFAMKRLLAADSGAIYQICKVFREDEIGRLHNSEFTMLEWYVPGFDHLQLMEEIDCLMTELGIISEGSACDRMTYAEAFHRHLDINVHSASIEELHSCAEQQGISIDGEGMSRDDWLDLLMGECISSQLGLKQPEFIMDYPASQAALARVRRGDPPVAERFELFWNGIELANGFHELSDANEQRNRFDKEVARRKAQGKKLPDIDEKLLAALEHGLPDCAGVALGVDRLLMNMLGKNSIEEVMSFYQDRS